MELGGSAGMERAGTASRPDDDDQVDRLGRTLAIVLDCLREAFPQDFHRRCAYSARAIVALLGREGVTARAVGGRFTALAVGTYGERLALQGFEAGPEPFPHLWVETADWQIDLGPYLLPFGSPFPIVPMPALIWDRAQPLPAALRYTAIDILPDAAPFSTDPAVAARADWFVRCCLERAESGGPFPHWIATGEAALAQAATAGDAWALAARHFDGVVRRNPRLVQP